MSLSGTFKRKGKVPEIGSWGNDYRYNLLLLIPVINALADSTIYYFSTPYAEGINPGIIRGVVLLIFIAFFGLKRIINTRVNKIILFFLAYLFILTILSSSFRVSFLTGYIKWFVAFMMFPIGFYYIRTHDSLIRLILAFIAGALIICINLVAAQFTGYGISAYVDDSFYIGGAGVGITNQLALVILMFPVILRVWDRYSRPVRWLIIITGILSLLFVVLSMKRAGRIGLAGGGLIFFYLTPNKRKVLKYLFLVAFIILVTFPFYQDILMERYNARIEQTKLIEEEGRYMEFFYVMQEFREGNIWHKLFGSEAFNTAQFFGPKYFNRGRMIHGDFSAYVYGSGLAGIFLYFSIFGMLFMQIRIYHKRYGEIRIIQEIVASFYSVLAATFLISATGSGSIGEKCMVYLFFGAVLGYLSRFQAGNEILRAGKIRSKTGLAWPDKR
ncbi:MAG: hypothetical protein E4G95_00085 [Bacteroidia bacterium]|nr:MAG: hypothetical protein E4G95_00085 [Bacteroidia bacterium]